MAESTPVPDVNVDELREAIQDEYREVARHPDKGFHFHTGRALTKIVGYEDAWLDDVPETVIASFAGTGNPFSIAPLTPGENVVDVGCGAGIDSFVAAAMVAPDGHVVGVDMTQDMLDRAEAGKSEAGLSNVEFRQGFVEDLPVEDGWADVVISNGVINLAPDKLTAYREIHRVLGEGGRMQIADILVDKPVSQEAKKRIDLWTG